MIVTVAEALAIASPPPEIIPPVFPGTFPDAGSDAAVGVAAVSSGEAVVVMVTCVCVVFSLVLPRWSAGRQQT